jgi:branched-chain amino acid transport system permease protein
LALIVVPILLALLGIAFEYLALRPLQGRSHIEVALVTLGPRHHLGQIIIYFYGGVRAQRRRAADPVGVGDGAEPVLSSLSHLPDRDGSGGHGVCWLCGSATHPSGLYVRAVSQDPSVARMMGINADRLSLLVTSLRPAFAGVAGVLAGPICQSIPEWTSR